MSIAVKVRRVQRVFDQLEKETAAFKASSGIHCLPGCGNCCTKPNIEASTLEFLPFAFHLFINRQHNHVKERLNQKTDSICVLFQPTLSAAYDYKTGRCGEYQYRGLICRLFGYAATRDKNGKAVLSTCKWIKAGQADKIESVKEQVESGKIPHYLQYYQKLIQIDFRLGQDYHPINKAILRAIHEVENYYQYRGFPYHHRKPA